MAWKTSYVRDKRGRVVEKRNTSDRLRKTDHWATDSNGKPRKYRGYTRHSKTGRSKFWKP